MKNLLFILILVSASLFSQDITPEQSHIIITSEPIIKPYIEDEMRITGVSPIFKTVEMPDEFSDLYVIYVYFPGYPLETLHYAVNQYFDGKGNVRIYSICPECNGSFGAVPIEINPTGN